jgi:DNA-binding PadR family transcriptional regulator
VTKRPSGVGPPRKFYTLNDAGRGELATFWTKWMYVSSRIDKLKEGGA